MELIEINVEKSIQNIENENCINNIYEPTMVINSETATPSIPTVLHITDMNSCSSDPALWPNENNVVIEYWIHRGRKTPDQNLNTDFIASSRVQHDGKVRTCSPKFFYFTTKNGETVNREWLIYSPSTGNIFCFYCILFGNHEDKFSSGYSDWPHGHRDINKHERSVFHLKSIRK